MKKITVYCASSMGGDDIFRVKAFELGEALTKNKIDLVYGGAKVGLMGAVADGALADGGKVIGILPHFLANKELQHESLTEAILVETMHERKAKMADLADGFIALPGGFGTMDELFEILTWAQLSLHHKPVGLLNIRGYYEHLLQFIDTSIEAGFVRKDYKNLFVVSDDVDDLLSQMAQYKPIEDEKW